MSHNTLNTFMNNIAELFQRMILDTLIIDLVNI